MILFFRYIFGSMTPQEYERQKIWKKIQKNWRKPIKIKYDSTLDFLSNNGFFVTLDLSSKNLKRLDNAKSIKYRVIPD